MKQKSRYINDISAFIGKNRIIIKNNIIMRKEKEIEMLSILANEDTYFTDFFGKYVSKMHDNIRNDFPIEMGLTGGNCCLVEFTKDEIQLIKTVVTQCIDFQITSLNERIEIGGSENMGLINLVTSLEELTGKLKSL